MVSPNIGKYYRAWEIISDFRYILISGDITRLGPTAQISIPPAKTFGIAFIKIL
jgi:hypothetical protein